MKTSRKEKVLFIEARHIYRQIDRAHREFSEAQIELISNIVRLYRYNLEEKFNLRPTETAQFFPEWNQYLPELTDSETATLDQIRNRTQSLQRTSRIRLSK